MFSVAGHRAPHDRKARTMWTQEDVEEMTAWLALDVALESSPRYVSETDYFVPSADDVAAYLSGALTFSRPVCRCTYCGTVTLEGMTATVPDDFHTMHCIMCDAPASDYVVTIGE